MVNLYSIGLPGSFRDAIRRIRTNLNYFHMNYDGVDLKPKGVVNVKPKDVISGAAVVKFNEATSGEGGGGGGGGGGEGGEAEEVAIGSHFGNKKKKMKR
ncbi:hypothetical protein LOK49_LG06G02352 [Camellia lanceoleosa]|uniref:Uncharacterized protein n=1 Tax=Camellia lanceoleosa TaxID=1840588 RepID=A0ACC0HDY1_9ERIC|nr:hypothetical protein LOK49_LG06G02352 [Camellia lanceoleosa]